jgi:DNA polymerase-3 subunit delta
VIDFFAKNGIAAELTAKTSMELERQIMAWVGKRGGQISKNNAAKIIEYAGTELSLLKNEVEKLCAYSNGAEITLPMIDSLVTKNLHAKIFALSDSVLCRNSNQAFSQLNALFYQREDPIAIVNVLGSAFVDVYRVRVAGESGVQNRQLAEDFQYKNRAFVLDKAAKNSRTISTAALREGLTAILNTEAALKSTQCDAKLMVEKLLAQLLLIFK